jgi:hypothetical protein
VVRRFLPAALSAGLMLAATAASTAPPVSHGAVLATPFPHAWATDDCLDCSPCGVAGHKTFAGDSTSCYNRGDEASPVHGCNEGISCSQKHPPHCNIETEEQEQLLAQLEQLRIVVARSDWRAVRTLLRTTGGRIEYNGASEAIQAVGCGEQVLVHIPVPCSRYGGIADVPWQARD